MDAAERAELDALRRRAYGPGAEALGPAELARLIELEDGVRAQREPSEPRAGEPAEAAAGAAPPARDDAAGSADGGAAGGVQVLARPAETSAVVVSAAEVRGGEASGSASSTPGTLGAAAPSRRTRRRTFIVAGIAVLAVGAAVIVSTLVQNSARDPRPAAEVDYVDAPEAYSFTRDLTTTVLLRIPLDGSFGSFVDLPDADAPTIPASGPVQWVEPLGEYYGWNVWIAGANGALQREHCIVVEREDRARGRCVPAVLRNQSALIAVIPYSWIPADERPDDMTPDQRLGFWWGGDNAVVVIVGATPEPR